MQLSGSKLIGGGSPIPRQRVMSASALSNVEYVHQLQVDEIIFFTVIKGIFTDLIERYAFGMRHRKFKLKLNSQLP